jgi:class 3 adenylate cyclase
MICSHGKFYGGCLWQRVVMIVFIFIISQGEIYMKKQINGIIKKATSIPFDVEEHLKRNFRTVQLAFTIIIIIHFFLIFLFLITGARELALFNCFSVLLWVLIIFLFRKNIIFIPVVLATAEIILHQALCIYYLGWEAGFQYHLIAYACGIIIFPFKRKFVKMIIPLVSVVSFVILLYYSRTLQQTLQLDPLLINLFNVANIITAFGTLIAIVFYFDNVATVAEYNLRIENERAEALLLNILPYEIAQRLKKEQKQISESSDATTILFADICDFTKIAESIAPDRLVEVLNKVFSRFDDIVDRHGVEKIKTIGDSYMVASGIPVPRKDHAEVMADVALEMIDEVKHFRFKDGAPLQIRIGFHAGTSIAGVIGKKKFTYDIWGDTVNTAQRMEGHSEPGMIQVNSDTYEKLKDRYEFQERGDIDIKGKGTMKTYFLIRKLHA